MKARDFILLALSAMGTVKGKSLLHNRLYFLCNMIDDISVYNYGEYPAIDSYKDNYYEPLSNDMLDELGSLTSVQFVTRSDRMCLNTDRDGFESTHSTYKLTKDGKEIVERLSDKNKQIVEIAWNQLGQIAGKLDYMQLALAAKLWFHNHDASHDTIVDWGRNYHGNDISDRDIKKVEKFLGEFSKISSPKTINAV